ncbi:hypothetical protein FQA39_LY18998 [Lamprigera yunnana]|nr:hypothetical protein FQA39_LY18998 [Lamprigera yunnana]
MPQVAATAPRNHRPTASTIVAKAMVMPPRCPAQRSVASARLSAESMPPELPHLLGKADQRRAPGAGCRQCPPPAWARRPPARGWCSRPSLWQPASTGRRDLKAPAADGGGHALHVAAYQGGRAVHGEVDAGLDHAGGDHGHDGDEGFHQHAAVADVAGVDLVVQQLGRGARRDQRVKARHRAAGDGDEQEGEHAALPDRARAIHKLRERRHLELRRHKQNAQRQADDGADLEEGGQVIARRQQQPHRQQRGDGAVADQHPGDLHAGKGKGRAPDWICRHLAARPDGQQQQDQANDRNLANAARADKAHIHAHEQRNRHRRHHGEHCPRGFRPAP